MIDDDVRQHLKNLDTRLAKVEQFQELASTRRELKDEIRTSADETRRHFDVIAESLRDEIRLARPKK